MRSIFLLSIIIFTTSAWASDTIDGQMKCELKSNQITKIDEGKPNTFSQFTNGLKIGDKVYIDYRASQYASNFDLYEISIYVGRHEPRHTLFYAEPNQLNPEWKIYYTGKGVLVKDEYNSIYVTPDVARFESLKFGVVDIRRYYKSDWHGIGFDKITSENSPELQARIFSLDCRHTEDVWDLFVSKLQSLSQD